MEWLRWGPAVTILNVIDVTADKAELRSLMYCALGGSSCWRLGQLPRLWDFNEDRHGPLIPPRAQMCKTVSTESFIHSRNGDAILI